MDPLVDLDAKHVCSILWLVLYDVVVYECHVLPKN